MLKSGSLRPPPLSVNRGPANRCNASLQLGFVRNIIPIPSITYKIQFRIPAHPHVLLELRGYSFTPMSTPAQITANRLNSLQSTGPVTDAGKAASSANSFKHGLTATKVSPEHRDEFEALDRDLRAELQAANPAEERLVTTMIMAAWNLQRCYAVEQDLWYLLTHGDEPKTMAQAFLDDCKGPRALDKIHRYIRDHERSYDRAHRELRAARQARQTAEQTEHRRQVMDAVRAKAQAAHNAPQSLPQKNGFVSSPAPAPAATPAPSPARNRYIIRGDENPALRL